MTAELVTYGSYGFWLTLASGLAAGAFGGVLLGRWLTLLTLRDPLGIVARAYRELWRDIVHLAVTGELRQR